MTETLASGYSYVSTQRDLFNEYQHDRVKMVFEIFCILVLWWKVKRQRRERLIADSDVCTL